MRPAAERGLELMDGCFVDGVVGCIVALRFEVRSVSVVKFVAFGVLWRFVAFCGF
jgi:hypothetical protein